MRIFIASSGSESVNKKYQELTMNIATRLAKLDNKLVFGGYPYGMMRASYMTFKYEGKKIKAVATIEDAEEVNALELDKTEIVRTTFERTKGLYESSEAILILPGGIGTLAELFSVLDEKRIKKRDIPIVLFNYNDFYTPLLNVLKEMHKEHFINENDLKLIDIIKDEVTLEEYFKDLGKRN